MFENLKKQKTKKKCVKKDRYTENLAKSIYT